MAWPAQGWGIRWPCVDDMRPALGRGMAAHSNAAPRLRAAAKQRTRSLGAGTSQALWPLLPSIPGVPLGPQTKPDVPGKQLSIWSGLPEPLQHPPSFPQAAALGSPFPPRVQIQVQGTAGLAGGSTAGAEQRDSCVMGVSHREQTNGALALKTPMAGHPSSCCIHPNPRDVLFLVPFSCSSGMLFRAPALLVSPS